MRNVTPRYTPTPPPVAPSLASTCWTDEFPRVEPAPWATRPKRRPTSASATSQPSAVPATRRALKASWPARNRRRGARWDRSCTRLPPTSRWPASTIATAASTAVAPKIESSGTGSLTVRGDSISLHPSGESQVSACKPSPASPIIRSA